MARPRAVLPDPAALRALIDDAGRLAVRATPGARDCAVVIEAGAVLVKVRAPADKGAANEAVAALLAEALRIAPSRITLLRGSTARQKLFLIDSG